MHSTARTILAGLALACTQAAVAADQPVEARDPTYAKVCSYCHDKGIGPAIVGRQLPTVYIETVVRHGFRAMPSFRPTEIDNAALASVARWVSESAAAKK